MPLSPFHPADPPPRALSRPAPMRRQYDRLLNKYCRSGGQGVGLDLTADPSPPDDPYVQVGAAP